MTFWLPPAMSQRMADGSAALRTAPNGVVRTCPSRELGWLAYTQCCQRVPLTLRPCARPASAPPRAGSRWETPLMGLVDLLPIVDEDGDVLDAHAVVAVLAAVGRAQAEELRPEPQIHDILGAPVGLVAVGLLGADR